MFETPVLDLITRRYSCRSYDGQPIAPEKLEKLRAFLRVLPAGPFGSSHRFEIVAAEEGDGSALKGLGTYGFIKQPAAFVVGVMRSGAHDLEDFGYQMELVALKLTELGLGNCWLGGTFARGRFAKAAGVDPRSGESLPAVLSVGNVPAEDDGRDGRVRKSVGGGRRKPWNELFFDGGFDRPLEGRTGTRPPTVPSRRSASGRRRATSSRGASCARSPGGAPPFTCT